MNIADYRLEEGRRNREACIEAYLRLKDVDAVAREVGLNRRTVMKHTRGVRPTPKSHVRYTEEQYAEVERWLRENEGSIAEASRTFGIGRKQLERRFPDLGWTQREAAEFAGAISALNRRLEKATYA